jgi:hypothetical protein
VPLNKRFLQLANVFEEDHFFYCEKYGNLKTWFPKSSVLQFGYELSTF